MEKETGKRTTIGIWRKVVATYAHEHLDMDAQKAIRRAMKHKKDVTGKVYELKKQLSNSRFINTFYNSRYCVIMQLLLLLFFFCF
jgi:predicted solute-binding protein